MDLAGVVHDTGRDIEERQPETFTSAPMKRRR